MSDPFVFDHNRLFNEPIMEQHGSHMIIKNVQKPEKTKYVTIDTRFRDQYDTNLLANYNITLPERVSSVKSMKVLSLEMPLTYFNVSSSLGNNSFQLKNPSTSDPAQVIVLGDNTYGTGNAVTTLNNIFTAHGLGWISAGITIAIDPTSGKMTLGNSNAVDIQITFDTIECTGGTGPKGGLSKSESLMSKLGWSLGFRLPSYTIPKAGSITGESIADFSGIPYFYLILDEFKNSNPHSFIGLSRTSRLSSQQILARMSVDSSSFSTGISGGIMSVEDRCHMVSDTRTYGELVDLQRMNIKIVDQFGRIMNFNGLDFSFCLQIIHE